jgi:catechol 2,3-dioxygenase-like lactoylglutathione lyase family enzyme
MPRQVIQGSHQAESRLLRIELTVSDLTRAERFYVDALGFTVTNRDAVDPGMEAILDARRIQAVALQRGGQTLVLQAFDPPGASFPPNHQSCDQSFQHFAIPVADMADAYARLQPLSPTPISHSPQQLPARSGGATAFKFRDPDGHPLELIQFPDRHDDGIDHSAIVVADAERSIAFYRDQLGFRVASRQINTGPEQDHLDNLVDVAVEVVALVAHQPTPHLELLAYRKPKVRSTARLRPRDLAATRLVLEMPHLHEDAKSLPNGQRAKLIHDPDEHALLLLSPR